MFVQPIELKRLNKLIETLRRGPCRSHLGSVYKKSPIPKQKVLAFWILEKGIELPKNIMDLCERLNFERACFKLFLFQSTLDLNT